MKLEEWGHLIVSWANFLDPSEEISNLEDLYRSDLFARLLGVLCNPFEQFSGDKDDLDTFLKEQYPCLDLSKTHAENRSSVVLQATAFLIYCSLHHDKNELQTKMTELPNWTQLCLTNFLQGFVEVPKSEITEALIFSEISKIQSSRISESVASTNSPNFGTPVMYTSSPSAGEGSKTLSSSKKTSRVRRLRKEVEMLNTMKAELTEELEASKETISTLESIVQKKDHELCKLKLELQKIEVKEHVCEHTPSQNTNNLKNENEKLRVYIENLEKEKCALEDELLTAKEEKNAFYNELQGVKNVIQNTEIEKKILEEHKMALELKINDLKVTLEQLTITNKEQADYISELTRPKDDSKCFSDSQGDSLILPESLGQQVIDLEIKELQDVIENKESIIKTLETEKESIYSKLKAIEVKHSGCVEKMQCAESVIHELKDKEMILKQGLCKSNERESSLRTEIDNKNITISKLKEEIRNLNKTLEDREFEEGLLFTKYQAKEAEVNKLFLELNEVNKRLQTTEERYEEEVKLHLQKISDLDSTIGLMNNQFIKINVEKESLITELENKKAIEKDFKVVQSELETLRKINSELEKDIILKKTESSQLHEQIASNQIELKNVMDTHIKELNNLKQLIEQLQSDIVLSRNKESELLNEILSKNNVINNLEKKLVNSEKELQNLEAQLLLLKDTISNKDTLLEKYAKEKNILMLDLELNLNKEKVLNSQLEKKLKELEDVRSSFKKAEAEISRLTLKCSEQELTIKSLYETLHNQNSEIKGKDAEIVLLQEGIKNVNKQLLEEKKNDARGPRPMTEGEEAGTVKKESSPQLSEADVEARIEQMKATYEKKVESYKTILKKRFAEKLEDLTFTLQNENTDLKEKILKEQERCAKLQSELWNASDKLLITQEQNRTLLSKLQARNVFEVVRPNEPLSPISKARSMEILSGRNRGIDNFARDLSMNESECSSRRSSIRSLPRGMGKKFSFSAGKVFPAAEEDGEVFDNRYLADLKAGICNLPQDPNRLSTLQFRNSLCPPHLKSSYPAETQFINTDIKEEDIKSGKRGPPEGDTRKTKLQSTYKKPGPPTPSKNSHYGAPSTSTGSEMKCPVTPKHTQARNGREGVVNESFVLRETNSRRPETSSNRQLKVTTPSRLKALFTNRKDENSPRRKSLFMKKN